MSPDHVKRLLVCVAFSLWLATPPAALAVTAGFDLFETDPQQTSFQFTDQFAIPAGFFDPGSNPFTGQVNFGGGQIGTFQGKDVGDADTIVQRTQAANVVPPFPSHATVPIEIVALNLVSVQPITVQVGGTTQTWDVSVQLSPTRPSQGGIDITKTGDQGGTFSSQLQVIPLFTFTRIPDGAKRTLDLGAPTFPPAALNALFLQTTNAPWRAGCVLPALAVSGLNDGFCPGLTTDGHKQLTLHKALRVQHGTYPAQPRLEHFKCYDIKAITRHRKRKVQLTDQFGAATASVTKPRDLCNPAQKNNESFQNRTDHLKCYAIRSSGFQQRTVHVRNQFGPDTLNVVKPERLCLPSAKQSIRKRRQPLPTFQTDHFKCYKVKAQAKFTSRKVQLKDQFHIENVNVAKPLRLCNPVQKNSTPIQHPVRHLVCYQIKDVRKRRFRQRIVLVRNQFGTEIVRATKPRTLCVPSLKILG